MGPANGKQCSYIGYEVDRLHQKENDELKRYAPQRRSSSGCSFFGVCMSGEAGREAGGRERDREYE